MNLKDVILGATSCAVIFALWHFGQLGHAAIGLAFLILAVSFYELVRIMEAPVYIRQAAHTYAWLSIGSASALAVFAALWL